MLRRLLVSDRLVQLRVERDAYGLDRLEAVRSESLFQLADAELQALDPRLVYACRLVVERLVEVVEGGQQPCDQVRRRVLDGVELLLSGALLEVLEVGGRSQVAILRLGERRFELCDFGLHRGGASGVWRLDGFAAPLWLVGLVRMLTRGHHCLDTAEKRPFKPRGRPCGGSRCGPPPEGGRPSGCTPCGSGRSRRAHP